MKRLKYIIGIILCIIFGAIALLLLAAESSGKDAAQLDVILAGFVVWMLFGVYRGCLHLFKKKRKSIYPTFYDVKYNVVPVSGRNIVMAFFNPAKMEFHTVGEIFVSFALWMGMMYFSPKFTVYFWLSIAVLVALKTWILAKYLKLNRLQNKVGREVLEASGEDEVRCYDVTGRLISAPDSTPETIIGPVGLFVDVFGTYKDYKRDASQFTFEQRNILSVYWYISEVYANGHYEFFTSAYGKIYPDTIKGLKAIGAEKHAEILERAVSEFDGLSDPIFDLDDRIAAIDSLDLDFEEADMALHSLDSSGEAIQELEMAYIRAHASAFFFKNPLKVKGVNLEESL